VRALPLLLLVAAVSAACGPSVEVSEDGTTTTIGSGEGRVSVKSDSDGGKQTVTLSTPQGDVVMESRHDLSELGAPVYPGAVPSDDGDAMARIETPETVTVNARFLSDDTIEQIVKYYRHELPGSTSFVTDDNAVVTKEGEDGGVVQVICTRDDESGKCEIVINTVRRK